MRYFNDRSSIAVTADGTLKALRDSGSWNYADILERIDRGLSGWNAANIDYNSYFYGITEDGIFYEQYLNQYGNSEPEDFVDLSTVHVVMSINDYPNLIGQTEDGKLLHYGEAQALRTFCDKYSFATPIKQILLNRGVICLLEDGTLMAEQNRIPKKNVSKMIYLEGQSYMAFLMKDGTVVATGSNHCGQCDVEDWENIVAIDAGGQCTIGLTADGQMLMAGSMN